MKMMFKQRFFSWLDSYDIFDEDGDVIYTVEGKLAWGHKLHILNRRGEHIGTVKQVMFTFLPRFEIYVGDNLVGSIEKKLSFFKPKFEISYNGWHVIGDWLEWDYEIRSQDGAHIASISKQLWNFTDTYSIDVDNEEDSLCALMVVLAIDAEKCSRN